MVLFVDGFIYRTELVTHQQVSAAWMQAAWQRSKRMPSLRSILARMKRPPDKATAEKMVEKAKQDFKKLKDEMAGDLNIKKESMDG